MVADIHVILEKEEIFPYVVLYGWKFLRLIIAMPCVMVSFILPNFPSCGDHISMEHMWMLVIVRVKQLYIGQLSGDQSRLQNFYYRMQLNLNMQILMDIGYEQCLGNIVFFTYFPKSLFMHEMIEIWRKYHKIVGV